MKRSLPIALLVIFTWSCEEPSMIDLKLDQILNGKQVAIHKGMLVFKDQGAFDSFVSGRENLSDSELEQWEKTNNFKSLKTIHEEIITSENAYLEAMNEKYNGDESITRKEIGFTPEAQRLMDAGLLLVNEVETLDLNIPVNFYARLLNKDGILRIGNDIHVPKTDFIMVIKDGDLSKVDLAKTYKPDMHLVEGIQIAKVERKIDQIKDEVNVRPANIQSCDRTSGSYRLIVYDEWILVYYLDNSVPCMNVYSNSVVKLRSLKKILGTWQNHKTGLWRLTSSFKADHYGQCINPESSSQGCGIYPNYNNFIRTIVSYTNFSFPAPYDHTWEQRLYYNYSCGPCESGGFDSCVWPGNCDPSNPRPLILMPIRSHNASGLNGITCYVGD